MIKVKKGGGPYQGWGGVLGLILFLVSVGYLYIFIFFRDKCTDNEDFECIDES